MNFGKETLGFFKNKEVLLLEDDLTLSKQITAFIEKREGNVTHCANLTEAENALNDLSFEAALFDLNLPDGESLDLLRRKIVPEYTLTVLMTEKAELFSRNFTSERLIISPNRLTSRNYPSFSQTQPTQKHPYPTA